VKDIIHALRSGMIPASLPPNHPQTMHWSSGKTVKNLERHVRHSTTKSKDPCINIVLWTRLTGMVGVLNLYLDPQVQYSWTDASLVVARVQGMATRRGCCASGSSHLFELVAPIPKILAKNGPFSKMKNVKGALSLN